MEFHLNFNLKVTFSKIRGISKGKNSLSKSHVNDMFV